MFNKIVIAFHIFSVPILICRGQINLVPNGSFEELSSCPQNVNGINLAIGWFQPVMCNGIPGGSSDIFNSCNSNIVSVPSNWAGWQNPKQGNTYAGISIFCPHQDLINTNREYAEIKLISPLAVNKSYKISFWVSLGDSMGFSATGLGAYLSADSLLYCGEIGDVILVNPQIQSSAVNPITETTNWIEISDNYIAQGGERFLTIGNFFDGLDIVYQVHYSNSSQQAAYYFIDDVSVTEIDTSIGIPEPIQANCKFYQTEDQKWVIESTGKPSKLSIYNTIGQLVYEHIPKQNKETIYLSLVEGLYYWQAGVSRGKILVK